MLRFTRSLALAFCVAALSVASCGEKPDTTLAFEVEQEISQSPALAGTQIHVTSNGGIVTLRGVVSREDQRATAENLALASPGVEAVENQIELASPAPPAVGAAPPPSADPTQ
ncbi:MAG: BON domain-containing protein [Myxococcota bacterium]